MATAPKAVPKPAAAADASAAPAAPPKSRKLLFMIVGVVLLAAAGGGAWYVFSQGAAPAANGGTPAAKPVAMKPPVFMSLETFTVNLQGEDGQQFLQANLTLQVADQAQADLIKLHMPQARNRLLLLLSSKQASDILTVEGKKKLASEIVEQLKQPFMAQGPKPDVSDVFFTSFVVQ